MSRAVPLWRRQVELYLYYQVKTGESNQTGLKFVRAFCGSDVTFVVACLIIPHIFISYALSC